jgi:SAM-dependent methyltransferase
VESEELWEHPDRLRWNERYVQDAPAFEPHPLVAAAYAATLPDGPVLELACGRSGNALGLAATGRHVVAVDISDVALTQLAAEAERRGLRARVECVLADVPSYTPEEEHFAFVLATLFWDPTAFHSACGAVRPGGLIAWEALAAVPDAGFGRHRVKPGELCARLPGGFTVMADYIDPGGRHTTARLLACRAS